MINETENLVVNSAKKSRPVVKLCYSIIFIVTEVITQIVPFSLIFASKSFAIASVTLVATIELAKFIICFITFCGHQRRVRFVPSPTFLVPAFFLVATSNLFFYCLNFVTPPTWDVIIQSRVVFMMLGGYVMYGRPIERRQWLAMVILLIAIAFTVWFCPEAVAPADDGKDKPNTTVWWVIASLCGAASSAISINGFEFISQADSRPITEKHTQLHFFCTVISVMWAILATNGNLFEINVKVFFPLDFYLSVLIIAVWTIGGLVTTFIIVYRLSDCTDDPSTTTAWLPTATLVSSAVVCSVLFPSQKYSSGVLAVIIFLAGASSLMLNPLSPPPSCDKQSSGITRQQEA